MGYLINFLTKIPLKITIFVFIFFEIFNLLMHFMASRPIGDHEIADYLSLLVTAFSSLCWGISSFPRLKLLKALAMPCVFALISLMAATLDGRYAGLYSSSFYMIFIAGFLFFCFVWALFMAFGRYLASLLRPESFDR